VVCSLARYASGTHPPVTVPAGFVQVGSEVVTADGAAKVRFYYKRLTAADAGSYDFSWTGAMGAHLYALCFLGGVRSGDPVGANFTSVAGTFGGIPALSVTVAFAPALVWTMCCTANPSPSIPSGYTAPYAHYGLGIVAHRFPGTTGTHTASGAANGFSTSTCAVLLAVEPHPDTDLSKADLLAAAEFAGDLTVSGTHVLFRGEGSTAESVTADVSVVPYTALSLLGDGVVDAAVDASAGLSRAVACVGAAYAASDAAADLAMAGAGVARDLAGTVRGYVDASAGLSLATALDGAVWAAADASGVLGVAVPLDGAAYAATDAAADLVVTGATPALDLAGAVLGCADASAELVAERALAGAVFAYVDASAELVAECALAGAVFGYADASAELEITGLVLVDLDGAVLAFVDASAELDATRALGATVAGVASMGADLTAISASGGALAPITRNGPAMAPIARPTTEMASASRPPQ
jgi:hypothetical protein